MPPGETNTRLADALAPGLSGAVLVATEDIQPKKASDAIHEIEVPTLLELNENRRFTLAFVGTIPREDDPQGAARPRTAELYQRPETEALTHYSSFNGILDHMGGAFAKERLRRLRAGCSDALTIDIQTRRASTAFASDADLVFRTLPPVEDRVPGPAVWEDLQRFLTVLSNSCAVTCLGVPSYLGIGWRRAECHGLIWVCCCPWPLSVWQWRFSHSFCSQSRTTLTVWR